VNKSKNGVAFFPAVFVSQPTWRFRKEYHSEEEADGRNHLDTPWDAESCCAVVVGVLSSDERATI
jgi:hypothetical protein